MGIRRWLQLALSPVWRDAATEDDVYLAYQLLLKRAPDDAGLAHYQNRLRAGLSVWRLMAELVESSEYRETALKRAAGRDESDGAAAVLSTEATGGMPMPAPGTLLDPKDLIDGCSIEQLNQWADDYYRHSADLTPLITKPYAFLNETPSMLQHLGLLLEGLHLGKGMTVLDFGAGSCWLSRLLAQMHIRPVCCDVSAAVLEVGRRLFAEYPPIGAIQLEPSFLVFDGNRLDIPDASVDRIICFDAFHHVPNQAHVISEFARVLKPGGIAGFSEPGARHSTSAQAQFEMRNYRILENNVVLDEVFTMASEAGFTDLDVSVGGFSTIPFRDNVAFRRRGDRQIAGVLFKHIQQVMDDHAVFFLRKGPLLLDSRCSEGLSHTLSVTKSSFDGTTLRAMVVATNTGQAIWLHDSEPFGAVKLGTHLYDASNTRVTMGHSRHALDAPVLPGQSTTVFVTTTIPPGISTVALDFVAERITWFETHGSQPVFLPLGS